MLSDARQKYIKDVAFKNGEVIISEVAKDLDVSLETVRRDINTLVRRGFLKKVHGGAVPVLPNFIISKSTERKSAKERKKQKLGVFIGDIIKGYSTVFLSNGTAVETITNLGNNQNSVCVITNSLSVAEAFGSETEEDLKINVHLLGGQFNSEKRYTFGPAVISEIGKYNADAVVITADAIDEYGAMCNSADEGMIISEMVNSSAKVILMADSSSFGEKAVFRHCPMDKIDRIVTDDLRTIPQSIIKVAKKKKIRIDII